MKNIIFKMFSLGLASIIVLTPITSHAVVRDNLSSMDTSATATSSDLLNGETAWVNGSKITGTMTNNGSISEILNAGDYFTIPEGYHDGSGKISTESLANQTSATATPDKILSGETAWVNGSKVTGTMANNGVTGTTDLTAGSSYVIPEGYTTGGTVTTASLSSQTNANAIASNLLSGKTAWVNGSKITGTIPSLAAKTYTPGTTDQTIAANQFLSGIQTIKGDSNLVSSNIKAGTTIFGVSGNSNVVDTSAGNATAAQILKDKVAYVDGTKVTGTMVNKSGTTTAVSTVTSDSSKTYLTISEAGYYDTTSKISIANSNLGSLTMHTIGNSNSATTLNISNCDVIVYNFHFGTQAGTQMYMAKRSDGNKAGTVTIYGTWNSGSSYTSNSITYNIDWTNNIITTSNSGGVSYMSIAKITK